MRGVEVVEVEVGEDRVGGDVAERSGYGAAMWRSVRCRLGDSGDVIDASDAIDAIVRVAPRGLIRNA